MITRRLGQKKKQKQNKLKQKNKYVATISTVFQKSMATVIVWRVRKILSVEDSYKCNNRMKEKQL